MGRFFDWLFKRKPAGNSKGMTITGQPVRISPRPLSEASYERNMARMRVCRRKMQELKDMDQEDSKIYRGFELEYQRRLLAVREYENRQTGGTK